jgi:hypothetical protein
LSAWKQVPLIPEAFAPLVHHDNLLPTFACRIWRSK